MRLINEGRRYSTDWPLGDADIMTPSDPCTEDVYRLEDPQGAGDSGGI